MCLITFAYEHHPDFHLILAGNRDEFYDRPAREARFWEGEGYPGLLAGKDLKAGGTWMGVHQSGKWGAITNYRDMSRIKSDAPSRGDILPEYLTSEMDPESYIRQHSETAKTYNGYNLLLGRGTELHYFSNETMSAEKVPPGIHGISNALLNTEWPKVKQARSELNNIISGSFDTGDLFELLRIDDRAPEEDLPNTGLQPEMEKAVSPIFISTDGYGTRCSTVLLIDRDGTLHFTERRYDGQSAQPEGESHYRIEGFL